MPNNLNTNFTFMQIFANALPLLNKGLLHPSPQELMNYAYLYSIPAQQVLNYVYASATATEHP